MRSKLCRRLAAALAAALLAGSAALPQAAAASAGVKIPILTYHDLTRDPNDIDDMTVTDERFRLDMEFLKEFGYTPLLSADLVAIHEGAAAMPDKPVMITFDDGYWSNYSIAYPILQQTGMKAVISVIAHNMEGDAPVIEDTPGEEAAEAEEPAADSPQEDAGQAEAEPPADEPAAEPVRRHLSWQEMYEMVSSGLVEIGSHTYNSHNPQYGGNGAPDGINGVMRQEGETFSEYCERIGTDLRASLDLITQRTGQEQVLYFAYPYGAYDSWMDKLLDENGVAVSVLSNNGASADISVSLRNLSRYGIKMHTSIAQMLRQTDTAVPALASVSVNGTQTKLPAYNIDGNNYVRVRDVAVLLLGTESGFDVQWNEGLRRVELQSRTVYEPLGTENEPLPAGSRTTQSIVEPTVADGVANMVAAYQMDGCTYYKLRSLGDLCGFQVDWNEETQTVEVTA